MKCDKLGCRNFQAMPSHTCIASLLGSLKILKAQLWQSQENITQQVVL